MTGPLVYRQKAGFCRRDVQFRLLRERTKRRVNLPDAFFHAHKTRKCMLLGGINWKEAAI